MLPNTEQNSHKFYLTNEGLKSEPNYLKNIKFIIGELSSTLCFSILTSKSQRTPLLRLEFPEEESSDPAWEHTMESQLTMHIFF